MRHADLFDPAGLDRLEHRVDAVDDHSADRSIAPSQPELGHPPILTHVDTAPAPVGIGPDSEPRRRSKWEAKQLDGTRPLGAWELYRALNDALDEGHDQFDLSNRDVRLALILMGGLNAALVILASQTSLGAACRPSSARSKPA